MSHEAFLQAILEEPDDDVHRLVYADWLDEHDDPRGTFIRAQVEAALLSESDPRRSELEAQAKALLGQHHDQWDRPLLDAAGYERGGSDLSNLLTIPGVIDLVARFFQAPWPKPPLYSRDYHRGFVDVIHFNMASFVERAAALFRTAPIQEVYFEVISGRLTDLAALPQLAQVRGLHLIYTHLREDALFDLFASPHLTGLRTLDMPGNSLSEHSLRQFAVSTCASRLTTLNLENNDISSAGARALAEAPALARLTRLDLSENPVGDEGVVYLAGSPHVANLTRLNLSNCGIGAPGALALARSSYFTQLTELNLGNAVMGREAMAELRSRFSGANLRF